jgi:hypothetical protein
MDKLKTIIKTFRAEVKSVDKEAGTIEMLIPVSTPSEDRSQEVCAWDCWNKRLPIFMKRPVLVSSHDYQDLRKQIGEWVSITPTQSGLLGKPKYYINEGNAEADWAFNIASKGMAAFSVGFIPYDYVQGKSKDEPSLKYTDCELLEVSQVVVPCNRDAIQGQRGKSIDPVINQLIEDIANAPVIDLTEKKPTQAEINDEMDFLMTLLNEAGLNGSNKIKANELTELIKRLSGCDKPVEDKPKIEEIDIAELKKYLNKRLEVL